VNVRVLSPAIDEISQAALWYESQRQGLGWEFWSVIDEVFSQIESNPLRFGKSEFATERFDSRAAIVPRFKYVVHYLVDNQECQIVAVAHAARQPGYWLVRTKVSD
jgi:hypothetical protein